ncbi:Pentatricopeptide repeat-containing protein [Hibiscus syriacus]|uniref:Pentatricopeptide repeat-containing protein n=1 Tax=Hibiscus syriacus TaxID=106335 RepID=A0A6A2X0F3_HIBSY|nr:pentatricopeptide repeat-containing protein At4g02820, mitochondrial-like [Hibiscus syriacus]KAE8660645.1 Pentatricopeptide repeat-containing protein [Hibiscus syriacus]
MLRRYVCASLFAARFFSTEAAVEKAVATNKGAAKTGSRGGVGRETLGWRLIGLVYPKRSAVITIRKWIEEGHTVRKYELNRIVRELRKLKRYKHALEICEWMRLQQDIKLLPGDYAIHLDLIAKVRGLASAEKFFEDLPEKMRGQAACSALLHTYVQNKLSAKAKALMEKMSECGLIKNHLPYNHMLSLYISEGQFDKVPEIVSELKKNASPDIVTYNLLLSVCATQNKIESAEEIYDDLKKAKIEPDWVTYSALTNLYIKAKQFDKATSTLKEMEKKASRKNRVVYPSLISLHTNMGDKDGVDRIWKKMKSCFRKMNDAEYMCMISSLVKLGYFEEAEKLYNEWVSVSGSGDTRIPNILLAAYINGDNMEIAENFYQQIVRRGISPCYTTWELLTWGYLKKQQMEKVLDCFKQAVCSVKKWNPNDRLVGEVFKKLEELGDTEGAEKLLVILRNVDHISTKVYNSLLRAYAKAGKMPLIIAERMQKDNVPQDEETHKLIKLTNQMRVAEVSSSF